MPAIPFISLDQATGRYRTEPAACQFLRSIKRHVGVVAMAGKYRTGKSFFLNRVILDNPKEGAFGVGSTVNACTKGIWLYDQTVPYTMSDGTEIDVVVMDSEGIGSLDADCTHDTRIFSLAILLSSFFLYNSSGSIDDSALKSLSLVTNVSKQIRINADQEASSSDLAQVFPTFCWVVRDFTLQLQTKSGVKYEAPDYLETALATKEAGSEADSVRQVIRDCFPSRTCVTMVRPCQEEEDLQALDCMHESFLRPKFVEQMKSVRQMIFGRLPIKRFLGNKVSGSMLVTMAESFVKAINDGSTPVIKDSWSLISEIQSRETLEAALELFSSRVEKFHRTKLDNPEDFQAKLAGWRREAEAHFEQNSMDHSGDLRQKLAQKLDKLQQQAKEKQVDLLRKCIEGILSSFEEEASQLTTVKQIRDCFHKCFQQLTRKVRKSESLESMWSAMLVPHIWKCIARVVTRSVEEMQALEQSNKDIAASFKEVTQEVSRHKVDLEAAQAQLGQAQEEARDAAQNRENEKHQHQLEMQRVEAQATAVTTELEEKHAELEELSQEMAELREKMVGNEALKLEMADLQATLEKSQQEVVRLKEAAAEQERKFKSFVQDMESRAVQTIDRLKTEQKQQQHKHASSLRERDTELEKLQEELKASGESVRAAESQLEEQRAESAESAQRLEQQVATLTRQGEEDKGKLVEAKKELEQYKKENTVELKQLQQKVMDQHMEFHTEKRDLETKLSCQNLELESCKRRLVDFDEVTTQRKRLKVDLEKATAEAAQFKGAVEWMEKNKLEKDQQIAKLSESITTLKKQLTDNQAQHEMEILRLKMS
jgi:hypothetical protein